MITATLHGAESLVLGNEVSRATVTIRGGHVRIESRKAADQPWGSPYSLPPWVPDDHPSAPAMLQLLRGDFFCFPFGVTDGLSYPHGETANRAWTIESADAVSARLSMQLEAMPGKVVKRVAYNPASNALWQEHVISGVEGRFNYGHHPILQVPSGAMAEYSTSPWHFGQVHPEGLAAAEDGDRGTLRAGAHFAGLAAVPAASGGQMTLARFPAFSQSEDLVMLSSSAPELAWNALSLPGFLWISLRRAADFPSTLLWLSNGGRPRPPWNGTHVGRIGIEDVCSYFHEGAHRSRLDLLARDRIETSRQFRANETTVLRHLQIAIPVDVPFGPVVGISYNEGGDALIITGPDGKTVHWACPFNFADISRSAAGLARGRDQEVRFKRQLSGET